MIELVLKDNLNAKRLVNLVMAKYISTLSVSIDLISFDLGSIHLQMALPNKKSPYDFNI